MKRNQIRILGGACVVLLGIAWLAGAFDRTPSTIRVPSLTIPVSEVTGLRVELPRDTLELQRQGTGWAVTAPVASEADSNTVSRLLTEIEGLSLDSRVTSNPDRYAVYGVDSTAAMVTLTWENDSEQLVISQQGRDYLSVYVRIGDDPDVYATNGRVTVTRDAARWRNRQVLRIAAHEVASVRVTRPEGPFEVVLESLPWTVDGDVGDSTAVAGWLRRFEPLTADGFFDDLPPQVLTDASYRIELIMRTGASSSLYAIEHDEAVALALGGGRHTYRVYESRLAQLFPGPRNTAGRIVT